jgi:hypothetical protein
VGVSTNWCNEEKRKGSSSQFSASVNWVIIKLVNVFLRRVHAFMVGEEFRVKRVRGEEKTGRGAHK